MVSVCKCYYIYVPESVQTDNGSPLLIWQKLCDGYAVASVWNGVILSYMDGTAAVYELCLDSTYGVYFSYDFAGPLLDPLTFPGVILNQLGDCNIQFDCYLSIVHILLALHLLTSNALKEVIQQRRV